jgi:hypothetical protein
MMSKPTINYWLDLLIGVAFFASAISGVVFLLPFPLESVLGLSYAHWDTIHTWGSLLMIGGVIAHLALHWKWLTHMTRKTLLSDAPTPRRARPAGVVVDTAAARLSASGGLHGAGGRRDRGGIRSAERCAQFIRCAGRQRLRCDGRRTATPSSSRRRPS